MKVTRGTKRKCISPLTPGGECFVCILGGVVVVVVWGSVTVIVKHNVIIRLTLQRKLYHLVSISRLIQA